MDGSKTSQFHLREGNFSGGFLLLNLRGAFLENEYSGTCTHLI